MIQFQHVTKRYDSGYEALRHVSFECADKEMVFLTGHSGAGKSTLLKLIALLERASRGQIQVNGYDLNDLPRKKIPYLRRTMGIVLQDPMLLPDRTVYENVALPLIIAGYRYQDIPKRVRASLDKVGLLKKEKVYPQSLSTGEQQRVGIARAVVHKPTLLLADEPTGNLDPELSSEIMELFQAFNYVGVTVLIATHDLSLIATMRHRILTLQQGQLV